jgi:hypothetical protein
MATGTFKFFNAKRASALSFKTAAARMCSFTFRRSSALVCTISTRARSFRMMCRPIRAAANPPPQTYRRSNFRKWRQRE